MSSNLRSLLKEFEEDSDDILSPRGRGSNGESSNSLNPTNPSSTLYQSTKASMFRSVMPHYEGDGGGTFFLEAKKAQVQAMAQKIQMYRQSGASRVSQQFQQNSTTTTTTTKSSEKENNQPQQIKRSNQVQQESFLTAPAPASSLRVISAASSDVKRTYTREARESLIEEVGKLLVQQEYQMRKGLLTRKQSMQKLQDEMNLLQQQSDSGPSSSDIPSSRRSSVVFEKVTKKKKKKKQQGGKQHEGDQEEQQQGEEQEEDEDDDEATKQQTYLEAEKFKEKKMSLKLSFENLHKNFKDEVSASTTTPASLFNFPTSAVSTNSYSSSISDPRVSLNNEGSNNNFIIFLENEEGVSSLPAVSVSLDAASFAATKKEAQRSAATSSSSSAASFSRSKRYLASSTNRISTKGRRNHTNFAPLSPFSAAFHAMLTSSQPPSPTTPLVAPSIPPTSPEKKQASVRIDPAFLTCVPSDSEEEPNTHSEEPLSSVSAPGELGTSDKPSRVFTGYNDIRLRTRLDGNPEKKNKREKTLELAKKILQKRASNEEIGKNKVFLSYKELRRKIAESELRRKHCISGGAIFIEYNDEDIDEPNGEIEVIGPMSGDDYDDVEGDEMNQDEDDEEEEEEEADNEEEEESDEFEESDEENRGKKTGFSSSTSSSATGTTRRTATFEDDFIRRNLEKKKSKSVPASARKKRPLTLMGTGGAKSVDFSSGKEMTSSGSEDEMAMMKRPVPPKSAPLARRVLEVMESEGVVIPQPIPIVRRSSNSVVTLLTTPSSPLQPDQQPQFQQQAQPQQSPSVPLTPLHNTNSMNSSTANAQQLLSRTGSLMKNSMTPAPVLQSKSLLTMSPLMAVSRAFEETEENIRNSSKETAQRKFALPPILLAELNKSNSPRKSRFSPQKQALKIEAIITSRTHQLQKDRKKKAKEQKSIFDINEAGGATVGPASSAVSSGVQSTTATTANLNGISFIVPPLPLSQIQQQQQIDGIPVPPSSAPARFQRQHQQKTLQHQASARPFGRRINVKSKLSQPTQQQQQQQPQQQTQQQQQTAAPPSSASSSQQTQQKKQQPNQQQQHQTREELPNEMEAKYSALFMEAANRAEEINKDIVLLSRQYKAFRKYLEKQRDEMDKFFVSEIQRIETERPSVYHRKFKALKMKVSNRIDWREDIKVMREQVEGQLQEQCEQERMSAKMLWFESFKSMYINYTYSEPAALLQQQQQVNQQANQQHQQSSDSSSAPSTPVTSNLMMTGNGFGMQPNNAVLLIFDNFKKFVEKDIDCNPDSFFQFVSVINKRYLLSVEVQKLLLTMIEIFEVTDDEFERWLKNRNIPLFSKLGEETQNKVMKDEDFFR